MKAEGRKLFSWFTGFHKLTLAAVIALGLAAVLAAVLSFGAVSQPGAQTLPTLTLPDWAAIFDDDGSLKDDYDSGGLLGANGVPDAFETGAADTAEFLQDNFSDGVATDMSALDVGDTLTDSVVYNDTVDGVHDVGNAYAVTKGSGDALQLFIGVERLDKGVDTSVDVDVTQGVIGLGRGAPWQILGERQNGDLRVRLSFAGGVLSLVEIESWQGGAFGLLYSVGVGADGCGGIEGYFEVCGSPPPIAAVAPQVWDMDFQMVESAASDAFVEVGLSVGAILGQAPVAAYRTVLVSTLEDISIGGFGG